MPRSLQPATPAAAASILLVRDGEAGLEVLMVHRSRDMSFASGMLVFPGGRVDAADNARALRRRARSAPGADFIFRMAALRELFEETGLVLALRAGQRRFVDEMRRRRIAGRFRARLHSGRTSFTRVAETSDLEFELRALVPFAHWITPEISPKRFDTRFYLAPAPAGQQASTDGVENVRLEWARPADLIAAWQAGVQRLMFPTRLNLMKLARAASVAQALSQTRRTKVIPVQPEIGAEGQRRLTIPAEAGFGVTEATHRDLDPIEKATGGATPQRS